jgi:predicted nucleic acid-binding protein
MAVILDAWPDDAGETDPVDLQPLLAAESLTVVTATEAELDTFVDLTELLDDGEAMTLALAIHRGFAVASDDRRVARALAGRAPLHSTLDLLRNWVEEYSIDPVEVATLLVDVRERGTYIPGRIHPQRGWWEAAPCHPPQEAAIHPPPTWHI